MLNSLVIRKGDPIGAHSYVLELDHRRAGLQALYEEHCVEPKGDPLKFSSLVSDYISRGGEIHYVIDEDSQVVGSAYVFGSSSLLQNIWPVDRLFVAKSLDNEQRFVIAQALIASVTESAMSATTSRSDAIWLQVFIPVGALMHPESQPIYGALEASGLRGVSIDNAELWVRFIEPLQS